MLSDLKVSGHVEVRAGLNAPSGAGYFLTLWRIGGRSMDRLNAPSGAGCFLTPDNSQARRCH